MKGRSCSIVLFDLGGVLFEDRDFEVFSSLRAIPLSQDEMRDFWIRSAWAERIATGQCTPDEFASGVVVELALDVTPTEFLSAFATTLVGFLPTAAELLSAARQNTRIACLSNTNELDAHRFRTEFDIERHFEAVFFSNELGLRKPDAAAYVHVLDALGASPDEVLFLDDTLACVEGAARVGMHAEHVRGPEEARGVLCRYGVL